MARKLRGLFSSHLALFGLFLTAWFAVTGGSTRALAMPQLGGPSPEYQAEKVRGALQALNTLSGEEGGEWYTCKNSGTWKNGNDCPNCWDPPQSNCNSCAGTFAEEVSEADCTGSCAEWHDGSGAWEGAKEFFKEQLDC